jgi:HK97 gp10 family phage protein
VARQSFRIEGLAELDAALQGLIDELGASRSTARNTLLRALKAAAQPVAAAGEANAPKRTGELALSYTVGTRLSRRQRKQHRKESMVEVFVGPTPHPKSVQTEFGNAHMPAQPHLRPAWDSTVMRVLGSIRDRLAEQIEKTRARLARRAERLAAKMKA